MQIRVHTLHLAEKITVCVNKVHTGLVHKKALHSLEVRLPAEVSIRALPIPGAKPETN